ncbi:MAG: hypothetical protein ACFE0O_00670 [Opitutales bacterium]
MWALGNPSCFTCFGSLLEPGPLARLALERGYRAVGLSDWRGFYGAVPFSQACAEPDPWGVGGKLGGRLHKRGRGRAIIQPVFGTYLPLAGVGPVQVTTREPEGYGQLCHALTQWNAGLRGDGAPGPAGLPGSETPVPLDAFCRFWERARDRCWLSMPIRPDPDPETAAGRSAGRRQRNGGAAAPPPWVAWERRYRALVAAVGADAVWLELGWHYPAQRSLQRRVFAELGRRPDSPRWVIMTGARLADPGDVAALRTQQAIGSLTLVNEPHPDKLPDGDYGLPEADRLMEAFTRCPEAVRGTEAFVDGCGFDYTYGRVFMPHWTGREDPGGSAFDDAADDRRLRALCREGLARNYAPARYPWANRPDDASLEQRLERELRIVHETGYSGYFLIFHAIVEACRERGIDVLARGSAAGSLICYCLGVSNVCPFRFGLSFERFLNHERLRHSKLPDIDLDLPWDRRDQIIRWVYERFGQAGDDPAAGRVAMIGGFSTYQARAAIAEVARTRGLPESVVRRWTRYLPMGGMAKFRDREALLVEAGDLANEEGFAEAAGIALTLDGLPRHPMMHPCGIVIADRPLTAFMPLDPSSKGFPMTQMAMDPVEDLGLLKLDLLGQAGLAVLRDARLDIRQDPHAQAATEAEDAAEPVLQVADTPPDPADAVAAADGFPGPEPFAGMHYDDARVYALCAAGQARGVFHIESPAMTSLLRLCRCADVDCLVATVSVIRPGAANEDKKNLFARRYLGLDEPVYHHPDLEPILRESYGLMIYEEHIILVAHYWAGLDLGKADLLRRILVKKKEGEELEALGREFAACARRKGYSDREILTVWTMLVAFSGYMFNKAHGAAYAVEAFHGCWMKLNWPGHFLAAVLQNQRGFYAPIVYVCEALRNGYRFRLPDVCRAVDRFRARETPTQTEAPETAGRSDPPPRGWIDVPLWQIRGLSQRFHEQWLSCLRAHRAAGGAADKPLFADWDHFLSMVRPAPADLLVLARSGALDAFFDGHRHRAVWEAARIGKSTTKAGQAMLPGASALAPGRLPDLPADDPRTRAAMEQALLQFPVTLTPYALWLDGLDAFGCVPIARLQAYVGDEVDIRGVIVTTRSHLTLKKEPMKFVTLADPTGFCETTLFPQVFREAGFKVARSIALRVRIRVERDDTDSGLCCDVVEVIDQVFAEEGG